MIEAWLLGIPVWPGDLPARRPGETRMVGPTMEASNVGSRFAWDPVRDRCPSAIHLEANSRRAPAALTRDDSGSPELRKLRLIWQQPMVLVGAPSGRIARRT